MDLLPHADESFEAFLDGSLQVIQKKRGYRFCVDTGLLARFISIRNNEKALDLGTGCGILPLLLSHTTKASSLVGVEIQADLAELAARNVMLNRLDHRVSILCHDFRELRNIYPAASFHVVFSNPPYYRSRSGRLNPLPTKALARHEVKGTLQDLVSIAAYLLPNKGRCYLIYPASRMVDLLIVLRERKLEPKRLRFVHPRPGEPAKFILVESVKGTGAEAAILDPLIINAPGRTRECQP